MLICYCMGFESQRMSLVRHHRNTGAAILLLMFMFISGCGTTELYTKQDVNNLYSSKDSENTDTGTAKIILKRKENIASGGPWMVIDKGTGIEFDTNTTTAFSYWEPSESWRQKLTPFERHNSYDNLKGLDFLPFDSMLIGKIVARDSDVLEWRRPPGIMWLKFSDGRRQFEAPAYFVEGGKTYFLDVGKVRFSKTEPSLFKLSGVASEPPLKVVAVDPPVSEEPSKLAVQLMDRMPGNVPKGYAEFYIATDPDDIGTQIFELKNKEALLYSTVYRTKKLRIALSPGLHKFIVPPKAYYFLKDRSTKIEAPISMPIDRAYDSYSRVFAGPLLELQIDEGMVTPIRLDYHVLSRTESTNKYAVVRTIEKPYLPDSN